MKSKTAITFTTMAIAAVALLFGSGPILGNQPAFAYYYGYHHFYYHHFHPYYYHHFYGHYGHFYGHYGHFYGHYGHFYGHY
jgi:hypothetical protein